MFIGYWKIFRMNPIGNVQFHPPEVAFKHPEIKALITFRAQKNRLNNSRALAIDPALQIQSPVAQITWYQLTPSLLIGQH